MDDCGGCRICRVLRGGCRILRVMGVENPICRAYNIEVDSVGGILGLCWGVMGLCWVQWGYVMV